MGCLLLKAADMINSVIVEEDRHGSCGLPAKSDGDVDVKAAHEK